MIFQTRVPLLSAVVLAGALFSPGTQAQESTADSTIIYPSTYFVEWSPVTAQDMITRIPGIGNPTGGGFASGNGGRGLGSGGGNQILIDGKRMPGKENQASDQLSRIPAENVRHIELIRGTSGALDVRGSDLILNVILLESMDSNTISYEVNSDRFRDGHVQPGGKLGYSGQSGAFSYVLSAEAEPRDNVFLSKETSRLGDFSLNDEVREERDREQTSYTLSANIGYDINPQSSLRLNALWSENDDPTDVLRWTKDLRVSPNKVSLEREDIPGERENWEVGGDYQYSFNNGSRFKFLFIVNEEDDSSIRERYRVLDDGTEEKNLFLATASIEEERIFRTSYTMSLTEVQDIEMGVERAQTTLDSSLGLGLISANGTPSPAFGGLVPQRVNNANSEVEEIRYEPFIVHNWQINSRMSLESTLVYEVSEITQSGDVSNKRDFSFVKPKVDWRFDLTPSFQLRASAEKIVRQLDFGDFVASNDNQDNDAETQAGNANLKQEQVLRTDFTAEYRLPNDMGVVDGTLFWMKHKDVIDRIDVSPSPDNLQSANGNIGDGTMYGLNLNASLRMGLLNMPNLLVTSRFNVQDSEITDPFLGVERRFTNHNRGRLQVGFRHDIPRWNINYGMNWNNRFDGNMKRYDIDDLELLAGDPNVQVFVQIIAAGGTTFRFDARNATNNLSCRERQRFLGAITSGIIEEIEDQCNNNGGRVLSLKISGTF
ncbi:MAG: TonB-dependent receptor [Pseudomonadales bacterium]|nr:TonB-dependent receptor [Pseudomonadales bacterium]